MISASTGLDTVGSLFILPNRTSTLPTEAIYKDLASFSKNHFEHMNVAVSFQFNIVDAALF
jgi:hypothetical protein